MAWKTSLSFYRSKTGQDLTAEPSHNLHGHLIRHRLKRSKQRDLILTAFARQSHVTAQNLYVQLAEEGQRISLGTIYRTMNLFCRIGLAKPQHFGTHQQFDRASANTRYDHLICTQCGCIVEFGHPDIERLRQGGRRGERLQPRDTEA